jgi:hypothetical protein
LSFAGWMLVGWASVAEAQTVLFDGANLTVNGVAVGQTTGSHARISLNAISNALHRTPGDVDKGVHGNKTKSYPGTGLGVSVDTNGRTYLFNADLTPTEPNHFHGSLNVLGMHLNAGTLITSIKPKLLGPAISSCPMTVQLLRSLFPLPGVRLSMKMESRLPRMTVPFISLLRLLISLVLTTSQARVSQEYRACSRWKLALAVQGQGYGPVFDEKLTVAAWKTKPSWAVISAKDRADFRV